MGDAVTTEPRAPVEPEAPVIGERFRSEQLAVREVSGYSPDVLVVTFGSYTDLRELDREGFGEAFFRGERIDAVHVFSRDNHWYQYPETPEALAVVARIARNYRRVVTYGSSMGGYAAIRFGRAAGAQTALAISPQFSVDPTAVPFERRWAADIPMIDFNLERSWAQPFVATSYILYDPYNQDRRHVELFAAHTEIVAVPFPNSGHPSTGFLADLSLLQRAILTLARGAFDPAALRRAARAARSGSPNFFHALASRCRNPARRTAFARRAMELAPQVAQFRGDLALALCALGRFTEAKGECDRALELRPDDPLTLTIVSEFYIQSYHWERALDILRDLAERFPDVPAHALRLDTLTSLIEGERNRAPIQQVELRSKGTRWGSVLASLSSLARPRRGTARLPIELRVTTTPSPPPFAPSWRRHAELVGRLPREPVDLILIGDSLAHYWPESCWAGLRVFNFGVAGDKTQHAIWRLRRLRPYQLDAVNILVMLGTNNLGADDGPEAICAGIEAVVRELRRIVPQASCSVVEVPPCGPEFAFRSAVRLRTNELLRASPSSRSVNIDAVITTGFSADCRNYLDDRIHFSEEGYRVLTRFLLPLVG